MLIIDIESNTSVGGLTLDPAGMHCPSWDDAFVSSLLFYCAIFVFSPALCDIFPTSVA